MKCVHNYLNRSVILILVTSIVFLCCTGCAADPLTNTVVKADLIALGTITAKTQDAAFRSTLLTLTIEKVLKGDPSIKEVIVKIPGWDIYDILPIPIERFLRLSDRVLLSLAHEDGVYRIFTAPCGDERSKFPTEDGVLWIRQTSTGIPETMIMYHKDTLEYVIGRICRILRINNIPNSLHEPCPEPFFPHSYPPCHDPYL